MGWVENSNTNFYLNLDKLKDDRGSKYSALPYGRLDGGNGFAPPGYIRSFKDMIAPGSIRSSGAQPILPTLRVQGADATAANYMGVASSKTTGSLINYLVREALYICRAKQDGSSSNYDLVKFDGYEDLGSTSVTISNFLATGREGTSAGAVNTNHFQDIEQMFYNIQRRYRDSAILFKKEPNATIRKDLNEDLLAHTMFLTSKDRINLYSGTRTTDLFKPTAAGFGGYYTSSTSSSAFADADMFARSGTEASSLPKTKDAVKALFEARTAKLAYRLQQSFFNTTMYREAVKAKLGMDHTTFRTTAGDFEEYADDGEALPAPDFRDLRFVGPPRRDHIFDGKLAPGFIEEGRDFVTGSSTAGDEYVDTTIQVGIDNTKIEILRESLTKPFASLTVPSASAAATARRGAWLSGRSEPVFKELFNVSSTKITKRTATATGFSTDIIDAKNFMRYDLHDIYDVGGAMPTTDQTTSRTRQRTNAGGTGWADVGTFDSSLLAAEYQPGARSPFMSYLLGFDMLPAFHTAGGASSPSKYYYKPSDTSVTSGIPGKVHFGAMFGNTLYAALFDGFQGGLGRASMKDGKLDASRLGWDLFEPESGLSGTALTKRRRELRLAFVEGASNAISKHVRAYTMASSAFSKAARASLGSDTSTSPEAQMKVRFIKALYGRSSLQVRLGSTTSRFLTALKGNVDSYLSGLSGSFAADDWHFGGFVAKGAFPTGTTDEDKRREDGRRMTPQQYKAKLLEDAYGLRDIMQMIKGESSSGS